MIKPEIEFQPKGGMCRNCIYAIADCSKLDFKSMPRICKGDDDGVVIVRCAEYKHHSEIKAKITPRLSRWSVTTIAPRADCCVLSEEL